MSIAKHLVTWSGGIAGPGYSIFYQNIGLGNPAPLGSFFAAVAPYIPSSITITVPNNGEILDELTGKMTGVWSAGTQVATVGTGTNQFAPQAGAQCKWGTNNFRNGRRVWGRTFIVPISIANFSSGGLVTTTCANAIQAAGAQLITNFAASMVVWSRPVYKKAAVEGDPPVLVRSGAVSPVTTATCPTKSATLVGRRDT